MSLNKLSKKAFFLFLFLFPFWSLSMTRISSGGESFSAKNFFKELSQDTVVVIQLNTDENLKGEYKGLEENQILFQHEAMGLIKISSENIKTVKIFVPEKEKIWQHQLAAGIKGSSGNSENFSLRAAAKTKRETERHRFEADVTYNLDYNRDNDTQISKKTGNRLVANARNDRFFKKYPRLSYYIAGTYEVDEFKDFEHQIYGNTGFGFKIVDRERFLLASHAGLGYSYKWGAPPNEHNPEGVVGLNTKWNPTKTQEVTASTEIFPHLGDLGEFRAVNKANWKVFFSEEKNLAIDLGVEHRYDSQPGTAKSSDLDYFAMINWTF